MATPLGASQGRTSDASSFGRRRTPADRRRDLLAMRRKLSRSMQGATRYNTLHHWHRRRIAAASQANYDMNLAGEVSANAYRTQAGTAITFSLDQVQSYTDLTGIYDKYLIDRVTVTWRWSPAVATMNGTNSLEGPSDAYAPILRYHTDPDDAGSPSYDALGASALTREVRLLPGQEHTLSFKPSILVELYKTAVTTGYGPKKAIPIDCDDPTVPHYGVKWACKYPNLDASDGTANSSLGYVTVDVVYSLRMDFPLS